MDGGGRSLLPTDGVVPDMGVLTACLVQRAKAGFAGLLEPVLVLRQLCLVQIQHDALHQRHNRDALSCKVTQGFTYIKGSFNLSLVQGLVQVLNPISPTAHSSSALVINPACVKQSTTLGECTRGRATYK